MKSMSRLALGAALLAGVGALAISVPAAAKEKKEEKAPGIKLSKEVSAPAQAAQAALAAKNFDAAEPLIAQVDAGAKTDDDRYIAGAFRLQLEVGRMTAPGATMNEAKLVAPLDALIANPKTPAADLPRFVYQRGIIAANAKQNAQAAAFFERAQQLGFDDAELPLRIAKLKLEGGDVPGGLAALQKSIDAQVAAGKKPDESLYRYAFSKTVQRKMVPESLAWMKSYIAAYPTAKNWRDVVFIYGIQSNGVVPLDKKQKVDLFRLLRMKKALADQFDYEIYAQYMIDLGLPYEAKTVIEEGRAAGKIPADSANANGLYTSAKASIAAEGSLAGVEAKAKSAANGRIALNTGDAYLGSGNYPKAIELYRVALSKSGADADADTVNTHLGIALAQSGDTAGAKAAFAAVKGAPRADIAAFWVEAIDTPAAAPAA